MIAIFLEISSYLLIAVLVIYIRQVLFFYRGLSRLRHGINESIHSITVIIPARNEEENIERCLHSLMAQRYPVGKLSVIVIDDQSSDRTSIIVDSVAKISPVPIVQFRSEESSPIRSPKIRAIVQGMHHASGDIIVLTDADCIVPQDWIATINAHFDGNVGIVTGLTVYEYDERISKIFQGIQFLDFISYTAVAAGAIGSDRMLVSNGSNMAFRIPAFHDAGGFNTMAHINTGDDSLLAQKIVETGRWIARFAFRDSCTVRTKPVRTWREMFSQRMRWVGQTAYYPPYMMVFMISTFIMYVVLAFTIPMSFSEWNAVPWLIVTGKFAVDYLIMHRFTTITGTEEAMKYFLPTALIHIPMVLIATIGGYFFSFNWKDRRLKKESV